MMLTSGEARMRFHMVTYADLGNFTSAHRTKGIHYVIADLDLPFGSQCVGLALHPRAVSGRWGAASQVMTNVM